MADTERKKRQRRNGTEQVEDIQKALVRARVTFIAEGDESMAAIMHDMGQALEAKLARPIEPPS